MDTITNQTQLDEMFKFRNQGLNVKTPIDPFLEIVKKGRQMKMYPNPDESKDDFALRVGNVLLDKIRKERKMVKKSKKKATTFKPDSDFENTPYYYVKGKKYWHLVANGQKVQLKNKDVIGIEDEVSINFFNQVPKDKINFGEKPQVPFMRMSKFTTKTNKGGGRIELESNPWEVAPERNALCFEQGKNAYRIVSVSNVISGDELE